MGKPTGFKEFKRETEKYREISVRVKDYGEIFTGTHDVEHLTTQGARCMDCGVPFCHGEGCPVANRIPEFNDLVRRGRWREACDNLHRTNNFPEITGRVCPAPCEAACTLAANDDAVSIRSIELHIAEKGFAEGWVRPQTPAAPTGRTGWPSCATVGSAPSLRFR